MTINDPLIGQRLGDYAIHSLLGQGGMARVYKGYDETLDRYAAVKVIEPNMIASEDEEEYRERFLREARSIARLNHPYVVAIYQFGQNQERNLYYMAMSFVNGRDLRQILKEYNKRGQRLRHAQVARIVRDIASALDYSHLQGVIHRDVKPSNIMVMADGHSVITDFGLALNAQEGTIGNTFGSVHYIAPEQAVSSAQAVPQSDFYSLGVVLFEMLTGRVPFEDVSAMSVALKHISDPPPMPSALNGKISPQVEDVILKALDKDPQRRFRSGMEFVHALEGAFAVNDDEDTHDLGNEESAISISNRSEVKKQSAVEVPALQLSSADIPFDTSADDVPTISDSRSKPNLQKRLSQDDKPTRRLAPKTTQFPLVMTIVAAVVILLVVGGLFAAGVFSDAGGEGGDNDNGIASIASATALAVNTTSGMVISEVTAVVGELTEESSAVIVPEVTKSEVAVFTNTPMPTITNVPPTATDILPSATPTLTEVLPTATATETPTSIPDTSEVLLRYDGRTLVLLNRSNAPIDVMDLDFVRINSNGTDSNEFEAREWNSLELSSLSPQRCFQVWTVTFRSLPADEPPGDICAFRQGTWQTSRPFWVTVADHENFEVRLNDVVLAVCPVVPRMFELEPADTMTECLVPLTLPQ